MRPEFRDRAHPLHCGEPAPWFTGRNPNNPRYDFSSVAGRHVLLSFIGSSTEPDGAALLAAVDAAAAQFDDDRLCFFGVSADAADAARLADRIPGRRFFLDAELAVHRLYGALDAEGRPRRISYLLDPRLRVVAVLACAEGDGAAHAARLLALAAALPRPELPRPAAVQAPVLVIPDLFEPALCRHLIELYGRHGGVESGFMREEQGRTVGRLDAAFKRRRDFEIPDPALRQACTARLHDRLAPEMLKAFQFRATRIERHIVACYDAADRGFFRAHRDNTTAGTAHRRFAVSLFLNSGEFDGGQLRFPEFGNALYSAPLGGAVVFSCTLLHEALPVTRGQRYMFLPFLYDEEAARVRERNAGLLGEAPTAAAAGDGFTGA